MGVNAAPKSILVVDDEAQIRKLLQFTLEDAGYAVQSVERGRDALQTIAHHPPAAVILDLGLPDLSGVDVLKKLREWTQLPVLVLSIFGQESSKVSALDAGADDYLTKPFSTGELLARLRVMLRREPTPDGETAVHFGECEINFRERRVLRDKQHVRLSAKEYALLRLLAFHHDKVLTHKQILSEIWGPEALEQTHYLRVFMMRLRRKLEENPDEPSALVTESNVGYRLISKTPPNK